MKAITLHEYGSPTDLRLTDVDKPAPGDGEVLVRVRAASVNPYDWHLMRGEPYIARMPGSKLLGPRRPRHPIPGADMAGQVEAVGANVTRFRPGDEVYAFLPHGAFAEYVCAPAGILAPKPAGLTFEQAAAIPLAGITAMMALRTAGRLQPGQRVLVNGASGGVGTFAVQLARVLGGEVTGVCGTRNVDLVRSIGANHVIDYTREDFTLGGTPYDLVIDIAGNRALSACRRAMTAEGTYVAVGGPPGRWLGPAAHMFKVPFVAPFVSQRMVMLDATPTGEHQAILGELAALAEAGRVVPVIDRGHPLGELPEAVRHVEEGHARGKVVITV